MGQGEAEDAGWVLQKNQETWGAIFAGEDAAPIVDRVRHARRTIDEYLALSTGGECTWGGNFIERLQGARVLEVGGGSGEVACMMLALGAETVVTTEITDAAEALMARVRHELGFDDRLEIRIGDFLTMDLGAAHSYDVVMVKEVLHHIPTSDEDEFVGRTAHFLKPDGIARFKDPAVNSKALDALRWAVPTPGRPSSVLQRKAYRSWRLADEHPVRDDSTKHYVQIMNRHYDVVEPYVRGTVGRFHRLVDSERFHDAAFSALSRLDALVPAPVQMVLGNVQRIDCSRPRVGASQAGDLGRQAG